MIINDMAIIRVIACKRGKDLCKSNFKDYINQLTSEAHKQKGFIKSESFMESKFNYNNHLIVSISDWNSSTDWTNWKESSIRNNIHDEYRGNIISEEFTILTKNKDRNNIFLL